MASDALGTAHRMAQLRPTCRVIVVQSALARACLIDNDRRKKMSWDIYVQDIPEGLKTVANMPDDFVPRPLGARHVIIEKIRETVPTANFSDPSWGMIEGPDFSIEVNLGKNEEVRSFAFHVRGGDLAAFVVADMLERLGLRAFDMSSDSGLFSIGPDSSVGQKRWRAYRDRMMSRG